MKIYPVELLQNLVNDEFNLRVSKLNTVEPVRLYEPVSYSLKMGGKRFRPVLMLLSFNMFSDNISMALPAALSVEVFHNFTLLHDDFMDKSKIRRNSPSVYVKFGENSAILSGDAMAFLSYRILNECTSERISDVLKLFTETAIEVCEGQQYDMDFENCTDIGEIHYLEMIRLKTAVLLGYCLKTGAMLGNADADICDRLYSLGINLGLAFQLQDDLLDTYGYQKLLGKKIGNDIVGNKKTYLLVKALETAGAEIKSELLSWLSSGIEKEQEKIRAVIDIYNSLSIKSITENKIKHYFNNVYNILENLPVNKNLTVQLKTLISGMQVRKY
jgi:geranylgeranyl diphosphate synthase type II